MKNDNKPYILSQIFQFEKIQLQISYIMPMGFTFVTQTILMGDTQSCEVICPECPSDFHQVLGSWSNQCKQAIKLQ